MALDPSIILQGRTPDMVARYSQGLATGQQKNQIETQNALAGLYKTQGAGILAGDQGAMNALAGIDPNAAMILSTAQLGMQSTRLGMDAQRQGMAATQQRMDMLTREEKASVAAQAAAMGAAERAAAAAEIENAVKMGMTAQSSEQWDALMNQMGAADLVGQFGQRQGLAARYMEIADVFKMVTPEVPEWRTATPQEAAANGAVAGQINVKTGKFDAQNPPSKMVLTTNPDGSVTLQQGPGAGDGKTTVGQVYNPNEVQSVLGMIDAIAADPNLPRVLGPIEGGGGNNIDDLGMAQRAYYGGDGTALVERIGQLQNNAWLSARAMLKGGGAITDYESRKAEGAVARLSRAKSETEFKAALGDLRSAIVDGMAKLDPSAANAAASPAAGGQGSQAGQGGADPLADPELRSVFEKYQ